MIQHDYALQHKAWSVSTWFDEFVVEAADHDITHIFVAIVWTLRNTYESKTAASVLNANVNFADLPLLICQNLPKSTNKVNANIL